MLKLLPQQFLFPDSLSHRILLLDSWTDSISATLSKFFWWRNNEIISDFYSVDIPYRTHRLLLPSTPHATFYHLLPIYFWRLTNWWRNVWEWHSQNILISTIYLRLFSSYSHSSISTIVHSICGREPYSIPLLNFNQGKSTLYDMQVFQPCRFPEPITIL